MTSKYTLDAIIGNTVSVNALIWTIRNGKFTAKTLRDYREHVEALSALLVSLEQQEGSARWIEPVPFSQIVGRPVDEKRRLEWRGWFKSFESTPIRQPRKIAA